MSPTTAVATAVPSQGAATILVDFGGSVAASGMGWLVDTFTRTVANGWGSANTNQAWASVGTASQYSTNGTTGLHAVAAINTPTWSLTPGPQNPEVTGRVAIPSISSGVAAQAAVIAREDGTTNNCYVLSVVFGTAGTVTLQVASRVNGVETILATSGALFSYVGNQYVWFRAKLVGSNLMMRAWPNPGLEPAGWQLQVTDTSLTAAGRIGVRSLLPTSWGGGTPFTFSYDELYVQSIFLVNLYRVTPDGARTAVRNSPALTTGDQVLFWDAELPLNTLVSYLVDSPSVSGTGLTLISSNSVTVTGYGWLGDPLLPALNRALSATARAVYQAPLGALACDTTTGIILEDLGPDETYGDASGLFHVIGANRGRAVTQARPSPSSRFRLITKQVTDRQAVDALMLPGRVLCLRLDPTLAYDWAPETYGVRYVLCGQPVASRPPLELMTWPNREWTLPYDPVDAPPDAADGSLGANLVGVSGATFNDLQATGKTFAQVQADAVTFTQVAQGTF